MKIERTELKGVAIFFHFLGQSKSEKPTITKRAEEIASFFKKILNHKNTNSCRIKVYYPTFIDTQNTLEKELTEIFLAKFKQEFAIEEKAEKLLERVSIKNKEEALRLRNHSFKEYCLAYTYGNPLFDDPGIMEPRSQVRERFFLHLQNLINDNTFFSVSISFYEVLEYFIDMLFAPRLEVESPLKIGEIFKIYFFKIPREENFITFLTSFREKEKYGLIRLNPFSLFIIP